MLRGWGWIAYAVLGTLKVRGCKRLALVVVLLMAAGVGNAAHAGGDWLKLELAAAGASGGGIMADKLSGYETRALKGETDREKRRRIDRKRKQRRTRRSGSGRWPEAASATWSGSRWRPGADPCRWSGGRLGAATRDNGKRSRRCWQSGTPGTGASAIG